MKLKPRAEAVCKPWANPYGRALAAKAAISCGVVTPPSDKHVAVDEEVAVAELEHAVAHELDEEDHLQAVIPGLQRNSVFQDQVQVGIELVKGVDAHGEVSCGSNQYTAYHEG